MTEKTGRMMSDEVGERFQECMAVLRKIHETRAREAGDDPAAIFDSLRIYMIAATAYLARSGLRSTDKDLREVLRSMLELGINDYQFNER